MIEYLCLYSGRYKGRGVTGMPNIQGCFIFMYFSTNGSWRLPSGKYWICHCYGPKREPLDPLVTLANDTDY